MQKAAFPTPMTEAEKAHALRLGQHARAFGGPLILPQPLYEVLRENGLDMSNFATYPAALPGLRDFSEKLVDETDEYGKRTIVIGPRTVEPKR